MKIADIRENFVGREAEITRFKEWLTNTDPEAPWILYLYDSLSDPAKKGGVGKTWLLRTFSDLAKEILPGVVIVHIDFFNITDRDGTVIAERVVRALKAAYPSWDISKFEESWEKYEEALRLKNEAVSDLRANIADALVEDLQALNEQLNRTDKHLLILFDTYELLQKNPVSAVLRLDQTFPDNYDFSRIGMIIAGRDELDWKHPNWRRRQDEILTMPISPFTQAEIAAYFDKLAYVEVSTGLDDIRVLQERTEGRPILVGLLNDVLSQRIIKQEDLSTIPRNMFEKFLVEKMNSLDDDISHIIWFMAHTEHRFNLTLLDLILRDGELSDLLQKVKVEQLEEQLLQLSFVRRPSSGEDFVLHDEMRPLVVRYVWNIQDPNQSLRKRLSACAIAYYEAELQKVSSEQLRQAYTAELLYHKFYIDLNAGYEYFSEHFSKVVDLRLNSFARALLHEAQKFAEKMLPTQRYNLKYSEARLLQKEEAPDLALNLLLELEQEADQWWLDEYKADILFEKGVAFQQLSSYPEAVACFTSAIEIYEQRDSTSDCASTLNWLGFVYRKQGLLDAALTYYEDGLAIHQRLDNRRACAAALVSISDVYRLQGKVEEALRQAKLSWQIRQKLLGRGEISEVYVGWSLNTVGTIYYQVNNVQEAETFFQKAQDIFIRTGHKRGLATIYNHLGKISMDRGDLLHAHNWFELAYSTSSSIDIESHIGSLNNRGRLHILEKRYQRAIESLQEAVTLAKEGHDELQLAEALISLAEAFKRNGQDEQSQQARQEASMICQKYGYYDLLGRSSTFEGDVFYEAGNYTEAFRKYGEACDSMTHYHNNGQAYRKGLEKLTDGLYEVPPQEIGLIVDELVAYWHSQGLDQKYPDFISACQTIKSALGD
jgi:tetratricopeptide (TPR) repeat protein